MSKKLMLLAAGVLAALAFSALPSTAAAGPANIDCKSVPCAFTATGTGTSILEVPAGNFICKKETGSGSAEKLEGSTGTVTITSTECTESFGGECHSAGQAAGKIVAGPLTWHIITLEKGPPAVTGLLITNVNVTVTCPLFNLKITITGSVIGEMESPACGSAEIEELTLNWATHPTISGTQRWEQETTSGTFFDLVAALAFNPPTDPTNYETAVKVATAHVKWNQKIKVTC